MSVSYSAAGATLNGIGPTLVPTLGTHIAGDMLILAVWSSNRTTSTVPYLTGVAGWTQLVTYLGGDAAAMGAGTGPRRLTLFYKEAASSAETAPTVNLDGSSTGRAMSTRHFTFRKTGSNPYLFQYLTAEDSTIDTTASLTFAGTIRPKPSEAQVLFLVGSDSSISFTMSTPTATGKTYSAWTARSNGASANGDRVAYWMGTTSVTSGSTKDDVSSISCPGTTNLATGLAGIYLRVSDSIDTFNSTLAPAGESGGTTALTGEKRGSLAAVSEVSQGLAVTAGKRSEIATALEQDLAVTVSTGLKLTTELDEAMPIRAIKSRTLSPAVETGTPGRFPVYAFEPPSYRTVVPRPPITKGPRITYQQGQSVARIDGTFRVVQAAVTPLLGVEGTDYFLGGHVYPRIAPSVRDELVAAGFEVQEL